MNPEIDIYLSKSKNWQNEMALLRSILLECELDEVLKWGKPCYAHNNTNIVMIQSFKDHCDLGFFKGALLKDTNKILTKAGEHSQSGRQLRFSDISEIQKIKPLIKSYIKEAIQLELSGIKFEQLEKPENIFITELQDVFKKNAALKKAFEALTPGRQRGYLIYFSAAKQSETRLSRINNNASKIMCGRGINDCTCGLSKRMPNCDGSHKQKISNS